MTGAQVQSSDVFLSYSRDDQPRARLVLDALEAAGVTVWWDAMLEGGVRFHEVTEFNLENAAAVVVLWSKISVASHWVHDEATRGRDRGVLIPVSIDGTLPPLGFRQFQWIDMSSWTGKAGDPQLTKLIDAVKAKRDGTTPVVPKPGAGAMPAAMPAPSPPRSLPVSRRVAMIGGGTALVGLAGLAAWQGGLFGGTAGPKRVAVLPFRITGEAGDQANILADLDAEIRTHLSRNPLLHVAAQTSSSVVAEAGKTASEICEELKVDYLLTATAGLDGEMLRIDGELVEGAIERTLLPIREAVPLASVLALHTKIAVDVIRELTAEEGEGADQQIGGTQNVAAYDAYLSGVELYLAGTGEASDRGALAKFEEAIRIDPEYAAAHTMRCRSLLVTRGLYASAPEKEGLLREAENSAQEAIRLAPDYPNAYTALGSAFVEGRLDMKAAREPFEKAAQVGAGDANVLSSCAVFKGRIGDFDSARADVATALSLDPLNPIRFRHKGFIEYDAGQFAEAKNWFEKSLSMRETSYAHYLVGISHLGLGDAAAAKASFEKETRPVWQQTGLAIADHLLGNRALAQQHFAELQQEQGDKSHYQYMQVLAQWGEEDAALAELDAAWERSDGGLIQLRNDPLLDPLRAQPRFAEILSKMGFS